MRELRQPLTFYHFHYLVGHPMTGENERPTEHNRSITLPRCYHNRTSPTLLHPIGCNTSAVHNCCTLSLHYVHNTVIESPEHVGVMEIKAINDYAEIYITPVNFSDTVPIRLSVHNFNARVFLWLRRLAVTQTLSLR